MESRSAQRHDLPAGTVTLLFADVEGSTRLLHALGERFAPARARMRELVRTAAANHNGAEVDWAGDGVFLAFPRARDAIAAATEIQRSLAAEPWPDEEAHRLRIGIHTGEPELGDEGYVGMDVVIAARICASAHGEQIVVSHATHDMAGGEPLPGASFRALGRHRLKDVPAAAQIFQLLAPGLREDFPPLKTLSASSLPTLHHRLVGRADALARMEALLAGVDVRLVTITGPGGAGKSRLALEVAARAALERPVHLVGLAPVSDAELIPSAIARAIGVRESSGTPLSEAIADSLNGTRALLFLDNLEQIESAASHVAELIDRAPDVQVLATSRTPLRLSTEHVLPLEPLTIADATTLFVELASARGVILRDDAMASVREICRRLDGLPLAIELVAARLAVLPPAEILRALGEGLALEMEGPVDLPERQRTLRAAIDWSYQRLTDGQRELHAALAVFADSGTLDDARAISGAGNGFLRDLEALVGWSLVRSESTDGEVRLSMLETVREHALDRMRKEGSLDELRQRHAELFLDLAMTAESELARPEQGRWLDRLEIELDNIRSALGWCLASNRVEDALRAVSALGRFWRSHGHISEARRWLSSAIAQADDVAPEVLANALWWSARQAAAQDDLRAEVPLLEEALALFRELPMPRETAFVLGELGWIALQQGDQERAEELCVEALTIARSTGDAATISGQLNYRADIYSARGDHARALAAHEEALALRQKLDDPLLVSNSTYNLGIAAWENGETERARSAFENTHALAQGLGDVIHTAAADFMLAELDLRAGDLDRANERIRGCLAVYTELESDRSRAECLVVLGGITAAQGHAEEATRLLGAADALRAGSPVNRFETPILERYGPGLEEQLGKQSFAALLLEGARIGPDTIVSSVVPGAARL
jgi:predicted ATPase/class 3 adenylate cyclase